ncbi:MAG: helix-turn-helix domain-containing protein [Lentisphaeria bacterium]|nr:helix-turn-helix domain-containing protein [Lentisphaeria bacterium]
MKEQDWQLFSEELSDIGTLVGTCCLWKLGPGLLTELRLREQRMHTCRFCFQVKKQHGENVCVRHDTETLAHHVRGKEPRPRLVRCPAGAEEYLIPVAVAGRILGAVLIGPFRGITGDSALPVWRKELGPALERAVEKRIVPICRTLYLKRPPVAAGDERIATVLDFMEARFADNITLEQAASQVFLSPSRLSHLFREKCGQDFSGWLTKLRVREAEALLRDTVLSIEEVALRSGFGDRSHFSVIFKKYNGNPPARFRRTAQAETAFYRSQILDSVERNGGGVQQ